MLRALRNFRALNPETGERVLVRKGEEIPPWANVTNPKITGIDAAPEPEKLNGGDEGAEAGASEPEVCPDLGDHTVAELRELAAEKGIDLGDLKRKADIVAAIEASC